MQEEEQGDEEAFADKNAKLLDDRAKEIRTLGEKDRRPHQVPTLTGRAEGIWRPLRLNTFQPIIGNRAQRGQEHKGALLLLY